MREVDTFILMDKLCFKREETEWGNCTMKSGSSGIRRVVSYSFPAQNSWMDEKHAFAVSYLNMSQGKKVRQQFTDVLQTAWPLKHISMLMDVRCSLKRTMTCSWFLSSFLTLVFQTHNSYFTNQASKYRQWTQKQKLLSESRGIVISDKSHLSNTSFFQ